jgi:hypothetical protein
MHCLLISNLLLQFVSEMVTSTPGSTLGTRSMGLGIYSFANGHCYAGSWHEGKKEGLGIDVHILECRQSIGGVGFRDPQEPHCYS